MTESSTTLPKTGSRWGQAPGRTRLTIVAVVIALVVHYALGFGLGFYWKLWWWNHVAHLVSAMALTGVVLHVTQDWKRILLTVLVLSVAWEAYEYYIAWHLTWHGWTDTWLDLVADTVGAVVVLGIERFK